MDLGVGSFVFSQGIVSAIPILKKPQHLSDPLIPKMITACKKALPLFVLGFVRVLLVKGTEYPVRELDSLPLYVLNQHFGNKTGACHRVWCTLELLHYSRLTRPFLDSSPSAHQGAPDLTDRHRCLTW